MSVDRGSAIQKRYHDSGGGFYDLVMVTATGEALNRWSGLWKRGDDR